MTYYTNDSGTLYNGDVLDVLRQLPDESVHCIVTSPPYWGLRDYGHEGQIGLESTPEAYVAKMVEVFRECRRVLRDDGTLWLNLGDSYGNPSAGRNDGNHRADGGEGGMSFKIRGIIDMDRIGPHLTRFPKVHTREKTAKSLGNPSKCGPMRSKR